MVGDILSLVALGTLVLSALMFVAAVIAGSRLETNARDWEDKRLRFP